MAKREILFRGWNKKNKKWIYGYYFTYRGNHFISPDDKVNPLDTYKNYVVDADTVGQYTGLDDSKGKHIYEGDILLVKVLREDNYLEYNTNVIFEDGAFWIKGENTNDYDTLLYAYINPTSPLVELEVVGNVFSNPEILKGGK